MPNDPPTAAHQDAGGRGSHPLLVGLDDGALIDGTVGGFERLSHADERIGTREISHGRQVARHDLDRHLAGHFTCGVASHAIGDDEQAAFLIRVRIQAVLIASANAPDVSAGGDR